jgi:hypothetical protein
MASPSDSCCPEVSEAMSAVPEMVCGSNTKPLAGAVLAALHLALVESRRRQRAGHRQKVRKRVRR